MNTPRDWANQKEKALLTGLEKCSMAFNFSVVIDVRLRDMDPFGHVNNAVYLTYFEIARVAYFQHLTGVQKLGEIGFIVARAECDYRQGAVFGQRLKIEVGPTRLGTKSFTLGYRITTGSTLIAEGSTVCVWYDYQTGSTIAFPPGMREKLEKDAA
ncbi:MAG TPA: thioesterase family protein [Candidatus Xenobia bacterium]|jgi:acyl-CoA thioester hydrolase